MRSDPWLDFGSAAKIDGCSTHEHAKLVQARPPSTIAFASVAPLHRIEVSRYGKVVRRWDVYLCRSYRTLSL